MFVCLYLKYPLFSSDFNEILSFLKRFSQLNSQISSLMKIHPVEAELFLSGGQTETVKQIVAFRKFSNAPKSTNTIITKNCALLRHYAASIGNFLPTFRGNLSVTSSRFKNGDYHYLVCNNPEERSSQLLRSRSLKSQSL